MSHNVCFLLNVLKVNDLLYVFCPADLKESNDTEVTSLY